MPLKHLSPLSGPEGRGGAGRGRPWPRSVSSTGSVESPSAWERPPQVAEVLPCAPPSSPAFPPTRPAAAPGQS